MHLGGCTAGTAALRREGLAVQCHKAYVNAGPHNPAAAATCIRHPLGRCCQANSHRPGHLISSKRHITCASWDDSRPVTTNPNKQSQDAGNGVFVLMLVNVIGFLADKVLAAPWMSALYLHHSYPQWWQFFTHMFMHANLDHLMSNMFFLLTFGRMVEEVEGPWGLGFVYLLGGLGAALVSFLLTPKNVVSVGASGAVFAIFSVSVLTRLTSFNFRRLLESVVLGQFVIKQVLGEVQQQVAGGLVVGGLHVSHIAHLGGALAGVLIVLLLSGVPADGKP